MDIKPTSRTIRQLLSSGDRYIIPRFQREYSWEDSNFREFLFDLGSNLSYSDGQILTSSYFIGNMLFVGDYDIPKTEYDVIDGQQRLTTITILFSVIAEHFNEIEETVHKEETYKYIMTEMDSGRTARVLKSKTHDVFFARYIQSVDKEKEIAPTSQEERNIQKAYEVLYKATLEKNIKKSFSAIVPGIGSATYADILIAIREQVLDTMCVAVYTKEGKNANSIFEILNAKGKRLDNIDLIKNRIFTSLEETEPYDRAYVKWKLLKETLYGTDHGVPLVTFYRHYWVSKYCPSAESKLFDHFRKNIDDDQHAYEDFLEDLCKNAENYMKIVNPDKVHYKYKKEYDYLVQCLWDLTFTFNIVQSRILLMAIYDLWDRKIIKLKDVESLVDYLVGFHFAYNFLLARRANVLDSKYGKYARELRKCGDTAKARKIIKKLQAELDDIYPSFDEFSEAFVKLTYTKKGSSDSDKSKYIIDKMYCHYEDRGSKLYSREGTVEHIISECNGEYAQHIGNLILLEKTLNNDADSMEYEDKKAIYEKSSYKWVKRFIAEHNTWEKTDFEARANEMARVFYYEVLNRPLPEVTLSAEV